MELCLLRYQEGVWSGSFKIASIPIRMLQMRSSVSSLEASRCRNAEERPAFQKVVLEVTKRYCEITLTNHRIHPNSRRSNPAGLLGNHRFGSKAAEDAGEAAVVQVTGPDRLV